MKISTANFCKFFAAYALGAIALTACGDENSSTGSGNSEIDQVESADSLPDCTAGKAGDSLFVADSGKVYYCADGEWKAHNNKNGEDGSGAKDSTGKTNGKLCSTGEYDSETQICDVRDNQVYKIVTIGEQTWMAENLNFNYNVGTAKSYCLGTKADTCAKYGRFYTWAAAMDSAGTFSANGKNCGYAVACSASETVRGVCPEGFHLPTKAEFETLIEAVGGKSAAGKALKAASGWDNGNGSDTYGFAALPAGYRYNLGYFVNINSSAYFWSSTDEGTPHYYAYRLSMSRYNERTDLSYDYKNYAYSVRCLKD